MYKRILVAIDGGVTSDLALRQAIGLAKDQNAMLQLVHVVDVRALHPNFAIVTGIKDVQKRP
jgi:nucleotide-binding universal stress UspA family protein